MGLGFKNEKFMKTWYLAAGGTGDGSSESAPLPFVTADLWAIPAGTEIEKVKFFVDTAITGTTVLIVGDDDNNDGYVEDMAANFATPGLYSNNAKVAGAYLRVQTAGGTDALDIDVVPSSKFYAATGKELKLACTTANTAGKARIVVEGTLYTK